MFRIPAPLIASAGGQAFVTLTSDVLIGNLWTYLGSPTGATDVILTVDTADVGDIQITNDWAAGSTFQINIINGGRVLGLGGAGGAGGADYTGYGDAGHPGSPGGAAISSNGFPVNVNLDTGYLFGGGGGGGGGSWAISVSGDAGGGGGGGQGWSGGAGGAAGSPYTGLPAPTAGSPGSRTDFGDGGFGGGLSSVAAAGGDGGAFGLGGHTGRSSQIISPGGTSFLRPAGLGGLAGKAFYGIGGATMTLNGSSDEATLRASGRILGETGRKSLLLPDFFNVFVVVPWPTPGTGSGSFRLKSDGDMEKAKPAITVVTEHWINGTETDIGANYEVRNRILSGDNAASGWDAEPGTAGTWLSLSSDRTWTKDFSGYGAMGGLIEVRRADIPSVGADDVMGAFWARINAETDQ